MLVLSLFPGIGLLDRAFEEEGFTVVRGPDVLWGGNVRRFHPPAGRFDGVIGGPPCKIFSSIRYVNPKAGQKQGNLIPEFERVVSEAQPAWFLMENVRPAPLPVVEGYQVRALLLNNRWMPGAPAQNRERRFSFGTRDGRCLDVEITALENAEWQPAVTASGLSRTPIALVRDNAGGLRPKRSLSTYGYAGKRDLFEAKRLQGLPDDFLDDAPFTVAGKVEVIGNGVPLPMGRAIARAVRQAMGW